MGVYTPFTAFGRLGSTRSFCLQYFLFSIPPLLSTSNFLG